MARMIDAVQVLHNINLHHKPTPVSEFESGFNDGINQAMWEITHAPTLTQPNDPLVTGFDVVDTKTGEYPDLEKIALKEDWAKHLMYCDMEGFAIEEDGTLLLLDECGRQACCPVGRFEIRRPPEGEEEEKHVVEITENL